MLEASRTTDDRCVWLGAKAEAEAAKRATSQEKANEVHVDQNRFRLFRPENNRGKIQVRIRVQQHQIGGTNFWKIPHFEILGPQGFLTSTTLKRHCVRSTPEYVCEQDIIRITD